MPLLARLNHYPSYDPLPQSKHTTDNALGDMALHEHTDPGAITLLYQDQDQVGGLQTLSEEHGWIDVAPEPYSFVVNLGKPDTLVTDWHKTSVAVKSTLCFCIR